jgi:broad specificity phosphatase PhoE
VPTVLLVRHGQASFGAADYDVLSAVGRRQAEIVAASLAERGYRPARLLSGTLRRQRETAAAFAGEPGATGTTAGEDAGPELEIEPRWDEYDPDEVLRHHSPTAVRLEGEGEDGAAEPLTNRAFQAVLEPALDDWVATGEGSPTAQTWPQFSAAGAAALAELSAGLAPGQTAVVVTSGGAIAAVVGTLLGAAVPVFGALNRVLVNASVTKLAIGSTGTNVVSFNDHSHLEAVDRALVTYR